jgi:hypothetical protein
MERLSRKLLAATMEISTETEVKKRMLSAGIKPGGFQTDSPFQKASRQMIAKSRGIISQLSRNGHDG